MLFEKDYFKNKKILNIGSGSDTFGTKFIDLYPMRKEVVKCNVDCEKYPFKDNTFDVVYSRCNFEHLSNPKHFLTESYRILKKGGILILITDNANYFGFTLSNGHHKGYDGYGTKDMHFALYTPGHLETHLQNLFKIKDSGYVDVDLLKWRNKQKSFFKFLFGLFAKIPLKYFKRLFFNRVYAVGIK
jgi:SAM-dependent methyltransferase